MPKNSTDFLPSGVWTGFYLEPFQPQPGWMHLYLEFSPDVIRGEGTDYVGPWILTGKIDLGSASVGWTKQYLGKHAVTYIGTFSDSGIEGSWKISDGLDGRFRIWPAHRGDLYEAGSPNPTRIGPH